MLLMVNANVKVNSTLLGQVFGIDCTGPFGDGILFRGGEWAPGGEYVQRLRVKNVSPKLKKLKYRLPTTKYFSLAYPEVITLSPGTMQVLKPQGVRQRFFDCLV